jgi:hypothetical protein
VADAALLDELVDLCYASAVLAIGAADDPARAHGEGEGGARSQPLEAREAAYLLLLHCAAFAKMRMLAHAHAPAHTHAPTAETDDKPTCFLRCLLLAGSLLLRPHPRDAADAEVMEGAWQAEEAIVERLAPTPPPAPAAASESGAALAAPADGWPSAAGPLLYGAMGSHKPRRERAVLVLCAVVFQSLGNAPAESAAALQPLWLLAVLTQYRCLLASNSLARATVLAKQLAPAALALLPPEAVAVMAADAAKQAHLTVTRQLLGHLYTRAAEALHAATLDARKAVDASGRLARARVHDAAGACLSAGEVGRVLEDAVAAMNAAWAHLCATLRARAQLESVGGLAREDGAVESWIGDAREWGSACVALVHVTHVCANQRSQPQLGGAGGEQAGDENAVSNAAALGGVAEASPCACATRLGSLESRGAVEWGDVTAAGTWNKAITLFEAGEFAAAEPEARTALEMRRVLDAIERAGWMKTEAVKGDSRKQCKCMAQDAQDGSVVNEGGMLAEMLKGFKFMLQSRREKNVPAAYATRA